MRSGGHPVSPILTQASAIVPFVFLLRHLLNEAQPHRKAWRVRKWLNSSLMAFAGVDAVAVDKLSSLTLDLLQKVSTQAAVAPNDVHGAREKLSLDSVITVDIKLSSRFGDNGLPLFMRTG